MYMTPEQLKLFDFEKACNDSRELREQIRAYVVQSDLWKAICKHIEHAKFCYLIERDQVNPVAQHKAHSAVQYDHCHLYVGGSKGPKHFALQIKVDYFDRDELEMQVERPGSITRKYHISPPMALLKKFDQKGFDAWVAECRERDAKDVPERELKAMETLIKKYPKGAGALVEELRRREIIE
jgi:hypothetical protein